VAAGDSPLRDAGGQVTVYTGQEWKLGSKDMLATNDKTHREILKVVRKI
jgi:fructose-1,6-bisphosphatase/inositol monophosphatase family enzyme